MTSEAGHQNDEQYRSHCKFEGHQREKRMIELKALRVKGFRGLIAGAS